MRWNLLSPLIAFQLAIVFSTGCAFISETSLTERMDLDGDGVSRTTDCDDTDPTVGAPSTRFVDADGDGFGTDESVEACDEAGRVLETGDCDDDDPAVHPDATEVCDDVGTDDDCDGAVNEGVEPATWYVDSDGDGYGDPAISTAQCSAPTSYVADATDCDDDDPDINPGVTWYRDADGDGFGDPDDTITACADRTGYLADGGDCDDADPAINPAAVEICDDADTDEDCDDLSDDADDSVTGEFSLFYADTDGDGYGDVTAEADRCDEGDGFVDDARDCDDSDVEVGIECAWIDVSTAHSHSCGIRGNGLLECWGSDSYDNTVTPAGTFIDVSSWANNTCAIDTKGELSCWGHPENYIVTQKPGGVFSEVSLGAQYACALESDGALVCWGGIDTTGYTTAPPAGETFESLHCGDSICCALDEDGYATCGDYFEFWYGEQIPEGPWLDLSVNQNMFCGVTTEGLISCLPGLNASTTYEPTTSGWTEVAAGSGVAGCSLADTGEVNCWGGNIRNVQPDGSLFSTISAAYYVFCGIETSGGLSCWYDYGSNPEGKAAATPPD